MSLVVSAQRCLYFVFVSDLLCVADNVASVEVGSWLAVRMEDYRFFVIGNCIRNHVEQNCIANGWRGDQKAEKSEGGEQLVEDYELTHRGRLSYRFLLMLFTISGLVGKFVSRSSFCLLNFLALTLAFCKVEAYTHIFFSLLTALDNKSTGKFP
jgi:hypothetical protein